MVRWILFLCCLLPVMAHARPELSAPTPPSDYTLPKQALWVSTSEELRAALAQDTPQTLILRDGHYQVKGVAFSSTCGHRIFAQHLGKAVLSSGITIGGDSCTEGAHIQGLRFDITNPKQAVRPSEPFDANETSAIEVWGDARNVTLLDITIDGNRAVGHGITVRQPEGLMLQRIMVEGFRSTGIRVDADRFDVTLDTPALLEDLHVRDVSRPDPKSSDGTSEACLWVGNTATVRRVAVRDCAWTGVWTGTAAHRAHFSDIDIDRVTNGIGLYLEHYTTSSLFERMQIGPHLKLGAICEWADPEWQHRPACDKIIIQDSTINTTCAGVYLDDGTRNTTIRRTRFINQKKGAFATYNQQFNLLSDTTGNDYRQMKKGARIQFDENNPC